MPLASGTRLAVYEIQAPIGAGGMGEVYRATDTKLGRGVAVKILPTEMAQDPDRLARFHREARAVATLNHPNVVTLYSVASLRLPVQWPRGWLRRMRKVSCIAT
jgi:serine/threonine protein kinase